MTGAKDAFSTLTFTYDADGEQLTAGTSSPGGQPTVTLTSTYDSLGNRATLSDGLSSAGVITYSYDSMHQMTGIASSYGGTTGPQVSFTYDNAGRMTKIARTAGYVIVSGPFHSMGTLTLDSTLSYDAASRLTTIIHDGSGSTVLETYTYDYNAASQLTAETNHEGTFSYTYDANGELTGVSNASSATYTYDNNGNRTMTGYTTGSDNETTAGAGYTYTYDADGNMTGQTQTSTGDVWTYTWDYRNRLTNVVEKTSGGTVLMTGTYIYDALDRRIGVDETVSGTETKTWTVYDEVNAYADFNGSGMLLNRYIYVPGANEILARVSASGTAAWYLTDNEGSIRDIVSTSGSVIDHIAYDAYGNVTSESSPSNGDRFKFDGMAWDAAIGEYYDNARYYDAVTGRFISQDPLKQAAGDDDLYRYVRNSPTNLIDPTGESSKGGGLYDQSNVLNALDKNKHYVIIYVDQPVLGSDALFDGDEVGHTFISLVPPGGKPTKTVGLYPKEPKSIDSVNYQGPGTINDDSKHKYDVARAYTISAKEYQKLLSTIQDAQNNPPKYSLNSQCTSFAVSTVQDNTSIKIPDKPVTMTPPGSSTPITVTHAPGSLGQTLKDPAPAPPGSIGSYPPSDQKK